MNRLQISSINTPSICYCPKGSRVIPCFITTALTISAVALTLLTTALYSIALTQEHVDIVIVQVISVYGGIILLVTILLLILLLRKMLIEKSKPFTEIAVLAVFIMTMILLVYAAICKIEPRSLMLLTCAAYIPTMISLVLLILVIALSLYGLYKQIEQIRNDNPRDLESAFPIMLS